MLQTERKIYHSLVPAGLYTTIVAIDAPTSAAANEIVPVTIRIKNTWTAAVHVSAVGVWNATERFIDWPDFWIPAGQTYDFAGQFVMPNRDVTIHAYSYYEDTQGYWRLDDETSKEVALEITWTKLAQQSGSVKLAVPVGWSKLAQQQGTIKLGAAVTWTKLAQQTGAIKLGPAMGWSKLAQETGTIIVGTPITWTKLDQQTGSIKIGLPPQYKLVYSHAYPRGKTYSGKAEKCTTEIRIDLPEQLFPKNWAVDKIAGAFEDKVKEQGAEMLDLKIYEDSTPLLWTYYRIEAVATKPTPPAGAVASPIAWSVIIPLILVLCIVVAFIVLSIIWKDMDWVKAAAAIGMGLIIAAVLGVGALAMVTAKKKK